MDLQIVVQNLKRLRTAKRISQRVLAESAGISLPAIKNLERGLNVPRINTLQAIAHALEVKLQDLFKPVRQLKTVRFRSNKRMQNRENILADVSLWLEDFNYLEGILDETLPFRLEKIVAQCSREAVVAAADLCRRQFGLKTTEPIHDICGLLESAGIKVYPVNCASDSFFGLAVGKEDGGPAVVVNNWERISVERRIFSAAHELGHIMLHCGAFDVAQTEENKEEEDEANLFAGHFLMPDEGFRREWNEGAGVPWVDRVLKVKRIFHVSYKAILARLKEYGVCDDSIWKKFNLAYRKRFNRKLPFKEEPLAVGDTEPYGLQFYDFYEERFSRLTRRAVEEDKISFSRGAEILRITVDEMQELINNWEVVL